MLQRLRLMHVLLCAGELAYVVDASLPGKRIAARASLIKGSSAADINAEDALAGAHVEGKSA